jgi:nitrogen-specific signal transduction histidine kinase
MDSSQQDLALLRAENERLREALRDVRAAQARDEAKTRFLAVVSHELRTPLSAVIGLADLLALGRLEDEQRAYVEAMRGCAQSLVGLVDEILDLARIEAGRLEMIRAPFAPRALMEGVAELLAPRAQARGLEIAAFLAPGVPVRVMGDGARVRQILLNLAGNALKFTQAGGVGLSLRAEGERLIFDVADTGPGVPEDRRAAIFEDFEQADAGAARGHEGAGLGLAISRRLAQRMGGALTLAATGPQGSLFRYEHPLDLDFSAAPAAQEDEAESAEEDASALTGLRVLVVGRSRFEIPFLLANLAAFGAGVVHAPDGLAAEVALVDGPAPDLVIIDCALSAERAGEIRAAARAAGAGRALLLFSPFERRAAGPQGLADFDGWLVKPVRAASLRERARAKSGADAASRADACGAFVWLARSARRGQRDQRARRAQTSRPSGRGRRACARWAGGGGGGRPRAPRRGARLRCDFDGHAHARS